MFYYWLHNGVICLFPADSKGRKDPKPATPSGGPSAPQTPPGPRPNAEPEQEPLVGMNPGHHSVAEPQPASEPAAEPAENSGRSPDLKVTVLFPVWGYDLLLRFDSILCRYNKGCPGWTSLVWFLCLHSKHVQQPTAPPAWWTAAISQSSEQPSSLKPRLKHSSLVLWLFCIPGSEVEGRAYLRWSQVRRSNIRVPPTV